MTEPYYRDDQVTLYHGDCVDVLPEIAAADMVLTDLPYGMTSCKWDSQLPLDVLWSQWRRLLGKDGVVVLTACQPFTSTLVMSNPKAFKTEWIWEKNAGSNFGTLSTQPMREHESVLVFCEGKLQYTPQMEPRAASGLARVQTVVNYATKTEMYSGAAHHANVSSRRPDLRYPRSIQKFNRERGLHTTQKPVGLLRYMIRTYSTEGALVVDHCAGSGSSLVAAAEENRKAIGVELEERYCELIAKRLDQMCLDFGEAS